MKKKLAKNPTAPTIRQERPQNKIPTLSTNNIRQQILNTFLDGLSCWTDLHKGSQLFEHRQFQYFYNKITSKIDSGKTAGKIILRKMLCSRNPFYSQDNIEYLLINM